MNVVLVDLATASAGLMPVPGIRLYYKGCKYFVRCLVRRGGFQAVVHVHSWPR